MKQELENGKLCARGTVLLSGQSLYPGARVADRNGSIDKQALACAEISEQVRGDSQTHFGRPFTFLTSSAFIAASKVLGDDLRWSGMPCGKWKYN